MMKRKIFFLIYAGVAVVTLLLAYVLAKNWLGTAFVLGVGLSGVFGWYGKKKALSDWGVNLFWVGVVMLVTFGALLDLNTYMLLIALVSGLGAWDLLRFHKSVADYGASEKVLQIENRHLTLLGVTLLAGGIFAVAVAFVRIELTFFLALVLGVVLIFALSMIIRLLQK